MTTDLKYTCVSSLNTNEKIKYVFQHSIKLHLYSLPSYFFLTIIFSVVTQVPAQIVGINWNSHLFYLPFFIIVIYFELMRRNTQYYVTNQRIIKEVSFLLKEIKNFYFTEFTEIYTYSKWGTFLGYNNLHLKRKDFLSDFFNPVTIGGLDNNVADEILEVLVDKIDPIVIK